jgi:beta-lactam-binding protein with PASTA domain/tRNA A-37 threonylcarbamoyl transferase component Bud32
MIGTLLGNRYELMEKIGEGGMAHVYRAKCHLLNRFVSVKILKDEYSKDKEFVEKFKREAAAVASLSDNNIVNIYDVGSQGDVNYIVMEYIKGKTLKEIIIQNERLESNYAIDIAIQIAKALECAHRNNIIHRDIKPHNILVTEDGVVKVTDFGIAKAASSVTMTNTSKVMGSAHYFSPEQAKGSFVDFRSDIYSLGIVLYEMVAGRVPFDAESPVSVALKHIQEPVVPPKQINELIPESLNKLILKAIEKEPIRRYQSIKDMLLDLQKVKANSNVKIMTNNFENDYTKVMEPVVVDNEVYKGKSFLDSKKKKVLIFSLAAVLVIVIGALASWFSSGKPPITSINKDIKVPIIIGKMQDEAKQSVEDSNLIFTIAARQNSEKPAGTVLNCSPLEGTSVKSKSEVRVYISAGPEAMVVPMLVDLDLATAKANIISKGLTLKEPVTEKYSDTIAAGIVMSQTPEPDAVATKDTKISLVVSKGPEIRYTTVPNLKDRTLVEANSILNAKKLKLGTPKLVPNTLGADKNGKITEQIQAADSPVKEGSAIDVSYYDTYIPPVVIKVAVPNVVGKTLEQAKFMIEGLKLKMGTYTLIPNTIDPSKNGLISSQIQPAGSMVNEGTTIDGSYYDIFK